MRVAADQFHRLVRAAWSPQAGTCFYRYHPSSSKRKVNVLARRISPERGYALACPSRHPLLGGLLHGRLALRVGWVGKEKQ